MNREITLQLPEEMVDEAESLAQVSGFTVDELIAKLLTSIMKPGQSVPQHRTLIQRLFALLPDDELLAFANWKMEPEKLDIFNQLLAAQKEQELSAEDAATLERLGLLYDRINLIKSYALVEAVRRKLLKAPEPA